MISLLYGLYYTIKWYSPSLGLGFNLAITKERLGTGYFSILFVESLIELGVYLN